MMDNLSDKQKGVLALILLSFIFASMGIFARYLNEQFTILQQTYLRIIAAFILSCFIFYKDIDIKKIFRITYKEWGVIILRSIALYVIGVTFISEAFITAKYSNASFISALPMTAILGFIILKEKFTLDKMINILFGFIGVVLIAVKDYAHLLLWGHGELFAFVSSFFFALSYIARKWHSSLLNNKEIAVIIFLISSILLFLTSILFGEGIPHVKNFSDFMIFIIVISGLFNVANLYLTNYGFQKKKLLLQVIY